MLTTIILCLEKRPSLMSNGYYNTTTMVLRYKTFFKKNGPSPASFSFIFSLFKQTIQFLHQIDVKKFHVHPVYGAGIRNHNLQNISLLP